MNLINIIKSNSFTFFIISFVLIIYTLVRKKNFKLLTIFSSVYFSLLLISGFFFFQEKKYQISDRREVVVNNKAEGISLVPQFFLGINDGQSSSERIDYEYPDQILDKIFFPLGTIPNKKLIVCEEDDGPMIRYSDRYGFYNEDFLWNFVYHDLVIVGDSHAAGDCVNKTPSQLLNKNKDIKVVNLGQGGNGPLTTYAATKEYFKKYNSNYTYYVISTNDYSRENFSVLDIDLEGESKNKILLQTLKTTYTQDYFSPNALKFLEKKLLKISNELVINYPQDKLQKNTVFMKDFISLRYLLRTSYNILNPLLKPGIRFLNNENEALLKESYREIEKLNPNKTVFIIKPNINCGKRDSSEYNYIKNILKLSNIQDGNILDTTKKLCEDHLWSKKGNHLNQKGYEVLSAIIRDDYLSRNR
jgi:hypothetical protein